MLTVHPAVHQLTTEMLFVHFKPTRKIYISRRQQTNTETNEHFDKERSQLCPSVRSFNSKKN